MNSLPRLLFFLLALKAHAGRYSLTPSANDGGGQLGTSAHYALNSSVMAGAEGNSINYTARTGYAGQLREPAAATPAIIGITITASPLNIPESSTHQLHASLCYNDGSWSPLAPGTLTWSILSGPITGISPTGITTAATVYQDTPATVQASFLTHAAKITLTVQDALPDNYGSYANDGLPDSWQAQYFGLNNPKAVPTQDPDHDGYDNLFEYNACTIPNDRLSVFTYYIIPEPIGCHSVAFSPVRPGCRYTLRGSDDLVSWAPVTGHTTQTGILRNVLDTASLNPRRFYIIDVLRE